MRLTLAEPKYLKESISVISELVTEAKLKITSDKIELVAMDPANVAMIIFKLLSSCFVEYKLSEPVEIGINLNNLKQILRRAKSNDAVTLELSDGKLDITLKSNTTRRFSLPIIELDDKEQKVPELSFPVIIETSTEILNEAVEDISIVSDAISLIAEPNKLIVKGEGDFSKANIEIPADSITTISNDEPDPVKSKYSLEYLKKMIGGSKISDKVTIMFDRDYPLRLDYKVIDKVQLSFILAPRVEND